MNTLPQTFAEDKLDDPRDTCPHPVLELKHDGFHYCRDCFRYIATRDYHID